MVPVDSAFTLSDLISAASRCCSRYQVLFRLLLRFLWSYFRWIPLLPCQLLRFLLPDAFAEDTWIISPACAFSSGPLTLRARSSVPIFPVPALGSILPAVISFSPSAAVPVIPFALICAVFPAFTFSNSENRCLPYYQDTGCLLPLL